ncbi:hypothetical protein [Prosthecobacter sp.]|uniref:hypothetical protein n=1 Tax=Prosthecobacter sp. TaxID=1965333 RepID=UPI003783BB3D
MSTGTLTLHRFNGDEIYPVVSATIRHHKDEDGAYAITFRAETCGPPIQTLPDTESLHAQPSAEWTLTQPKIPAVVLRTGARFAIPQGYDETTGEYLTNLYYCDHEPMDENEIVVLERSGLQVRARITALATDANFYDGSKARMKVVVEADFTLGV